MNTKPAGTHSVMENQSANGIKRRTISTHRLHMSAAWCAGALLRSVQMHICGKELYRWPWNTNDNKTKVLMV